MLRFLSYAIWYLRTCVSVVNAVFHNWRAEIPALGIAASIEKLISGWVASHAEVNLAKRYLEVTLTNIFQDIDMLPTVNYNVNALPMRRIGQR